jgi:hypothetical protein
MIKLIKYNPEPTALAFHSCNAPFKFIMGPVGSGKSTTCVMEAVMRSMQQAPDSSGVRRSRGAIVRNTFPQLISTSMNTWKDWVPEEICPITRPMNGTITGRFKQHQSDGTMMDLEVYFIAMDNEDDVGKMKSLELTWVWLNEISELAKSTLDIATSRIGRFPSKRDGGPTWTGVIGDTNPPDDEHWYYKMAEIEKPRLEVDGKVYEYKFFRQPPALLKLPKKDKDALQEYAPNQGQSHYPTAENIKNLSEGYAYYFKQLLGKDEEWIKVFVLGEYGNVVAGKPVYPEYMDGVHCAKENLQPYRGLPLIVGWDYGLTPSAVFCQLSPNGQFRIIDELTFDGGIRQFASQVVRPHIRNNYGDMVIQSVGDPAGNQRSQTTEVTCMEILAQEGIPTQMASTNEFVARRDAIARFMTRTVDGQPAFQLSPKCKTLRKGFQGRYRYPMKRTSFGEGYGDRPEKNAYSHCQDATQYAALFALGGYIDRTAGGASSSAQRRPVRIISGKGWT